MQVVADTTAVLKSDGENVKALFRRGQALKELRNWAGAAADLAALVKLQPSNKAASTELKEVRKQQTASKAEVKTAESARTKAVESLMGVGSSPSSSSSSSSSSKSANGQSVSKAKGAKAKGKGGMVIEEISSTKLTDDDDKPAAAAGSSSSSSTRWTLRVLLPPSAAATALCHTSFGAGTAPAAFE